MAYKRLGDLLTASGIITSQQLSTALANQKITGRRLGDELIESGILTERQLISALQMQLGVDYIDLTQVSIPVEMAGYVPKNIAKKYFLVPVKLQKDTLYIAMVDPLDFVAQEEVKTVSRKRVVPMLADRRSVEQSITSLYGNEGTAKVIEEMKREMGSTTSRDIVPVQMIQPLDEGVDAAPTIRFVNSIIERAFTERASDIHLEPQEGEMVVRMRIDGLLRRILTVPSNLQSTVISRLKIIGGMNISERKIPQDGHAMMTVKGHSLDIRINTMPTVYGEKVVMRLLDKSTSNITKNSIGLEGDDLKKYETLLKNTSGVILIVGPTGSGKSTTQFTMLRCLTSEESNIVTLEDPVEYNIPGVNQCQINEKTGMTFAAGLRAILRQDPDIISVGEIRDGETGAIAIRAAITGHLVLSTLHTNDAASTFARLRDIGVEPYLTASAMRGIISQRLVRKICPHCRTAYKPSEEELSLLEMDPDSDVMFYRGTGCQECSHSGFKGRSGVFEILMVDRKIRELVSGAGITQEIKEAACQNGMVTMKENCINMVLKGVTTVEEALKAINSSVD